MKTISTKRSLGAKSILSAQQENDLEEKIIRFAQKGFPLTSKVLRCSVYKFCEIRHKFNHDKQLAGMEWYRVVFLKRHPNISQRKAQLNPARAQKLNRFIVGDYFTKLEELSERTGLEHSPEDLCYISSGC